jgi:hypothetical protein
MRLANTEMERFHGCICNLIRYEEPSKAVQARASSSGKTKDSKIAYGVLSLIFAGLLVVTVLNERKHVTVGST